jgi:hypothetical protein
MAEQAQNANGRQHLPFFSLAVRSIAAKEFFFFTALSILIFLLLRWCYPSAYVSSDSYGYVAAASMDFYSGYRPMGYAWFLQLSHFIFPGLGTVMFLQYFLHIFAMLYFLFTLRRFFPPALPWVFRIFGAIALFNIPLLFLTQWLLSDSLNASFTFISFAALLRIVEKPLHWNSLLVLLIALLLAIETRFASLALFPLCVIVLVVKCRLRDVLLPLVLLAAVLDVAWLHNRHENEKYYREAVFSSFGGWAKANNASILLPHVKVNTEGWSDSARIAYTTIRSFDDSCFTEEKIFSTDFMWNPKGPGKAMIMSRMNDKRALVNYVYLWVHTGVVYDEYGSNIIRQHPLPFARYFLWPNTKRLFAPPAHSDVVSFPRVKVDAGSKEYFGISDEIFPVRYNIFRPSLLWGAYYFYQLLAILFIPLLLICFLLRRKLPWMPMEKRSLFALGIGMLCISAVLVWSHPVMYRYVCWLNVFLLIPVYALINVGIRKKEEDRPGK